MIEDIPLQDVQNIVRLKQARPQIGVPTTCRVLELDKDVVEQVLNEFYPEKKVFELNCPFPDTIFYKKYNCWGRSLKNCELRGGE